jgi:hypothetical protein
MGAIFLGNVYIKNEEIQSEFISRQKNLESQIDHLDRFVTDLISHKISLENANRQIEQMASSEKDGVKRGKLYHALRNNIELLTKIFNSISELESIKFKYHKEIDGVIEQKIRIIAIDIRRLEEKRDSDDIDLVGFFEKLSNVISSPTKRKVITQELNSDPEYKL